MKLVLTLLVRDEEDIISENIKYHLSQGVDFIIATDNNSVDSTPVILKEFEKAGLLHYIHETDDNYSQGKWVTRMAQLAAAKYKADWVINSDADEFWWPTSNKSIKETLNGIPENIDALVVRRSNFIPLEESGNWFEKMIYREYQSKNHFGYPLPPKVCHRALNDVVIQQGNHEIASSIELKLLETDIIEILHFPIRSYSQFENKIKLGGAAYERNTELNPAIGDCWRTLYKMYKRNELKNFFNSQLKNTEQLNKKLKSGEIFADTKLKVYIKGNNIFS